MLKAIDEEPTLITTWNLLDGGGGENSMVSVQELLVFISIKRNDDVHLGGKKEFASKREQQAHKAQQAEAEAKAKAEKERLAEVAAELGINKFPLAWTPRAIANFYLRTWFVVDLVAAMPCGQGSQEPQ